MKEREKQEIQMRRASSAARRPPPEHSKTAARLFDQRLEIGAASELMPLANVRNTAYEEGGLGGRRLGQRMGQRQCLET